MGLKKKNLGFRADYSGMATVLSALLKMREALLGSVNALAV